MNRCQDADQGSILEVLVFNDPMIFSADGERVGLGASNQSAWPADT